MAFTEKSEEGINLESYYSGLNNYSGLNRINRLCIDARYNEEHGISINRLEKIGIETTPVREGMRSDLSGTGDRYWIAQGEYCPNLTVYGLEENLKYIQGKVDLNNKEKVLFTEYVFWHEIFHCLTRCNPDFRAEMYKLIHFTVQEKEYSLPPSVFEYHISNPDVEHHNSYATFSINGQNIDCFTDFVTTRHFEQEGDSFFGCSTTALVPVDGSDTYYTPEQAENFDEIFGTNTDYVIDPEECMADNFGYTLAYGMDGPKGDGYPNPEIIEGIMDFLCRR